MNDFIPVTNHSSELADCANDWFFDEKYNCWCLEDILYTQKATTPKFQRLSIFVPAPYMAKGGVILHDGMMGGYTADNAPVVFENNSAGYMQMPHAWLGGPRCYAEPYLEHGLVYVTCGNRGSESKDAEGKRCGKAPINLVDLKMAIRFLRHNRKALPGNLDQLVSVGWSAGGAMSSLLSLTGDHPDFLPYLEESGAFMDESDAVYAGQMYCPIVDLDHADLAYEWCFAADKENESSPAGPGGIMTPFREALSKKLEEKYISYFNSLKVKNPENGEVLSLGEDGRSGSAYEYLMKKLNESATIYLNRIKNKEAGVDYTPEDYINGNYTYMGPAPMGGPGPEPGEKPGMPDGPKPGEKPEGPEASMLQGFAGPGVALHSEPVQPMEPPTLGDMLSRPPKGVEFHGMMPQMVENQGKNKTGWLSWDGSRAVISDLDSYVLNHRRRMKPCPSFDILGNESGENRVFGSNESNYKHFNTDIADAIEDLKEEFPAEYAQYGPAYAAARGDKAQQEMIRLINPLNYVFSEGKSNQAKYCRIRLGAHDADTSFSVSMTLACRIAEAGIPVDFAYVWDQPHSEADYPGEILAWIDKVCGVRA